MHTKDWIVLFVPIVVTVVIWCANFWLDKRNRNKDKIAYEEMNRKIEEYRAEHLERLKHLEEINKIPRSIDSTGEKLFKVLQILAGDKNHSALPSDNSTNNNQMNIPLDEEMVEFLAQPSSYPDKDEN